MVYFEKFVANLKVYGKFLRNNENIIELPFGSEYILFLKNITRIGQGLIIKNVKLS